MTDDISKAMSIMALASLLASNIPPSLRKRIMYEMLEKSGIRLGKADLEECEKFYAPPQLAVMQRVSPARECPKCKIGNPAYHKYCYNCGVVIGRAYVE